MWSVNDENSEASLDMLGRASESVESVQGNIRLLKLSHRMRIPELISVKFSSNLSPKVWNVGKGEGSMDSGHIEKIMW